MQFHFLTRIGRIFFSLLPPHLSLDTKEQRVLSEMVVIVSDLSLVSLSVQLRGKKGHIHFQVHAHYFGTEHTAVITAENSVLG